MIDIADFCCKLSFQQMRHTKVRIFDVPFGHIMAKQISHKISKKNVFQTRSYLFWQIKGVFFFEAKSELHFQFLSEIFFISSSSPLQLKDVSVASHEWFVSHPFSVRRRQ